MLKAAICSGFLYGKGDSSTFLITLNMVVPAPIPSARVRIARKENPGFARMPAQSVPQILPQRLHGIQTSQIVVMFHASFSVPDATTE